MAKNMGLCLNWDLEDLSSDSSVDGVVVVCSQTQFKPDNVSSVNFFLKGESDEDLDFPENYMEIL